MNEEVKIRIAVTKGTLVLAELHSTVDGGRHEFLFAEPIHTDSGRFFGGFALECWVDQEANHAVRPDQPIFIPADFKR